MDLSVVVPVFNEAGVIRELVLRIDKAVAGLGMEYEILVVNDGSTDETPEILAGLGRECNALRVLDTPGRTGQFRATKTGLARAKGDMVITMDGDLQDPPEVIPELVEKHRVSNAEVVFAVKNARHDPAWFMAGQAIYHWLQAFLSPNSPPRGAGSFLAIPGALAHAVSRTPLNYANISVLVTVLCKSWDVISYEKAGRYDEESRVGAFGLTREAIGSLFVSGALPRLLLGMGGLLMVLTPACPACGVVGLTAVAFGGLSAWRRSMVFRAVRNQQGHVE